MRYLAVDFGSTYTKLTAIDAGRACIVGTACAFTTIATNVMEGFQAALRVLQTQTGGFYYNKLLCCSSAGGGLAMIALGLVPELTAKAAKTAAEGAGAKVIKTYAYEISPAEQAEIAAARPDIVLLCGGTNGGNKEVILANARLLAAVPGNFSIIAAGNKSAAHELEAILAVSGKEYVITDNVMPAFGRLDVAPAQGCIRDVFIRRIIDAKGLSQVQAMTEHAVIPTPLAVLQGCELLSRGTAKTPGMGEFLAVDVGGATTDVYSMSAGTPAWDNVLPKGLPEPYAKRTVEGDLGMRYSAGSLLEAAGVGAVASSVADGPQDAGAWTRQRDDGPHGVNAQVQECAVNPQDLAAWTAQCSATPGLTPQTDAEQRMDAALARSAIALAVERHCGVMEKTYTPLGEVYTLTGKDLTRVPNVIGIGGALQNNACPAAILQGATGSAKARALGRMMPQAPRYFLDKRYIFSAMGLVGMIDPELALTIMLREIQPLPEGNHGVAE